jgi:hypothetical protein
MPENQPTDSARISISAISLGANVATPMSATLAHAIVKPSQAIRR